MSTQPTMRLALSALGLCLAACASSPMITGLPFGGACGSNADCGSMLCLSGSCTSACSSDCGCPDGFGCHSAGAVSVCARGTRSCSTSADAGVLGDAARIDAAHPIDAAVVDTCGSHATCSSCADAAGCGWCGASGRCVAGTSSGPSAGACTSGYAYVPSSCPAECSGLSCDACVGTTGCGWCLPECPVGSSCPSSCTARDSCSGIAADHCGSCSIPTPGVCSTPGSLSCGGGHCCAADHPFYCASGCYATEAAAIAACGATTCTYCQTALAPPTCAASTPGVCTSGNLSCGGGNCCGAAYPYYCPVTRLCYGTQAGATAACGTTACATCTTALRACVNNTSSTVTCGAGNISCGSACCDTGHPYYCGHTNLCYTTQDSASAACGGNTCTHCTGGSPGPTCTHDNCSGCLGGDGFYCCYFCNGNTCDSNCS